MFSINSNTHQALEALRRDNTHQYLWIDQICINQDDVRERSQQLPLMSGIFRQAKGVIIWLGDLDEATWDAVHLIYDFLLDRQIMPSSKRKKGDFSLLDPCMVIKPGVMDLQSSVERFSKVLQASWFTRMWVVQELAMAENASIMCGSKLLDFKVLSSVITGLSTLAPNRHRRYLTTGKRTIYEPIHITFDSKRECQAFKRALETSSASSRLRTLLDTQPSPVDLLDLLGYFRTYDCSDARDHVYGLMQLPAEFDRYGLTVNYNMSTDDVYLMTAKALLSSGQTNVLAFCDRAAQGIYARILPSWVPDWSANYRSQISMKTFSASSDLSTHRSARCSFEEPDVLCIAGSFVDDIHDIYPFTNGDDAEALLSLKAALKTKAHILDQYEDLTEAFTHTTIADREPQHLRGWRRVGRRVLGLLSSRHVASQQRELPSEFLATVELFREAKMLFSTSLGYIGLGSKELRQGDTVVILFGARVPFALRKTRNGCYILMGECYIHGVMDGEFMAKEPPIKDFRIV